MAYQVLARKYRPQFFRDVIGQEHVTRTLLNALAQGRIAHGYIFSGHRGIGKTTIARILAMALNCQHAIGSPERPTAEPCGTCDACTEIRSGSAVDVIEIDAATNRGIDEIRELRDAARYRPARDRYKIYILDEAHQITDAAFNALLKTLEEPPDHVVFMMATTQPEDIPQTIRSRSQHYAFHAVRFEDILTQLRSIADHEKLDADNAALALLAEAGDGSMRDALSIMDQAIASAPVVGDGRPHLEAAQIRELMGTVPNTVFERLLEWVGENNSAAVMTEIDTLLNAGNSPSQLARQMVRYLRNALMAKLGGESTELLQISDDERARVSRTAMLFAEEDLTRFLQIMLRSFDEMNYRQEPRFHLELGLLKLVHTQRLIPLEQLMSQLPAGGANASRPSVPSSVPGRIAASVPAPAATQRPASQPAPPRSVASSEAARGGSVDASTPPAQPTFSPFESDTRRKSGPSGSAVATEILSAAESLASGNLAVETAVALDEASAPDPVEKTPSFHHEPPDPQIRGHASSEVERHVADLEEEIASDGEPEPPASSEFVSITDKLRDAVTQALHEKGHETASALLGVGQWSLDGNIITVAVKTGKTMLSLTMTPDAERIARTALQRAGSTAKLVVVLGEGSTSPAPPAPHAAKGSIQSQALDNPLVKQAQELFRAEVRSILDLRGKP
ncbi:MAG: polymerase subunit gamma/tau [Acidobacteriaceae bacterium]|jgi:DNA polymerase-3 subunit gamma/tau|nr:polymerase subunit gamma/tau [Acidobacteriaceae bacterium]